MWKEKKYTKKTYYVKRTYSEEETHPKRGYTWKEDRL